MAAKMGSPSQANLVQLSRRQVSSRDVVMPHHSKELFFAVVGHVGSGTTEVAKQLSRVLQSREGGPAFDVASLKASDVICAYAEAHGNALPDRSGLSRVRRLQDLGDKMRENGDYSAVARALIRQVREVRAAKTGQNANTHDAIKPDDHHRAYILDSIRHPAEVQLLSHIYQDAFILVGVV
ncbi:MAG TPA: cytidine deaminase, partial [Nannocystis exedens]|nr:cytidine deaminase [Nannocystis exedens]